MTRGRHQIVDLSPSDTGVLHDVLAGLSRNPKEISAKYFYDERGSALFEAICDLPEYYVTRAELALMESQIAEIAAFIGPDAELVEFGSGSGRKTRVLLEAARPALYEPIDIARTQLETVMAGLAQDFPWLNVTAVCGDFTRPLTLPAADLATRRRVVYFPGSTIGNFTRAEAAAFLSMVRDLAGVGGVAVIGVDLEKDRQVLHAAYNDAQGITAHFNLNVLNHLNRVLSADFDLEAFEHVAFYDETEGRIEMHLRSLRDQAVFVGGQQVVFRQGELTRTEISCKYSVEEFQDLAREAGFRPEKVWFDPERLFSVHGLTA